MATVLQWVGAAGVLSAFGLSQRDVWPIAGVRYLTVNFVAGICLCAAAILTSQWGFVLLEGAWATIALRGLWSGRHQRAAPEPVEGRGRGCAPERTAARGRRAARGSLPPAAPGR